MALNSAIRNYAASRGVKHWQIAQALSISESSFTRKLRVELDKTEREKVLGIINKIADERDRGGIYA